MAVPVRWVKTHWIISLVSVLLIFAILIGGTFYNNFPPAVPTTMIAIMAPTVYYIYANILDRPLISIPDDVYLSVAPMFVPPQFINQLDEAGRLPSPNTAFLRPAIFQRIVIRNDGKSTARNAMVQIQLIPEEGNGPDFEYFGRWTDPGNSDRYDLLPGQSRNVQIMKVFLTTDFFPTRDINGVEWLSRNEDPFENVGDPGGRVRRFSNVNSGDLDIQPIIPREKPPERADQSVHGGWAGRRIAQYISHLDTRFKIRVRVIADNYKTSWYDISKTFSIEDLVASTKEDDLWQNQWGDLGDLKPQIQNAVSER